MLRAYRDESIPILFIWFNCKNIRIKQMIERGGEPVSLHELSREAPRRRRQKGRVPSGLSCLKRGRVELVLACPLKGTRKERLVSTWEMGPSSHQRPEGGKRSWPVLASTGCTRAPCVSMRSRDSNVIRLFGPRRRACICEDQPPYEPESSSWQHRCVAALRRVPSCRSGMWVRPAYVGLFVCICARGRGRGARALDSFLSLFSLAARPRLDMRLCA